MYRKSVRQFVCFYIVLFFCFILLFQVLSAKASQESQLIYVAGNPDCYPIEYYDTKEKVYKGLIPALLQEFSSRGTYRVEYLESKTKDERHRKYENRQAELISGCVLSDAFPDELWQSGITVFQTEQNGEMKEYRLLLTEIADEQFRNDLMLFFSNITNAQKNGIMITETGKQKSDIPILLLLVAGMLVLILTIVMIILLRKNHKQINNIRLIAETDTVTGIGNYNHLDRYYKQFINDKNRVLYSLIYFYIDIDRVRRLSNNDEANAFLRQTALILNEYTADTDILARVSDSGFVLLKLSGNSAESKRFIPLVLHRIREYSQMYDKSYLTEAYSGVYYLQSFDRDLSLGILKAEQGSYYARAHRIDYVECSDEIVRYYEEERNLQKRTRAALENEEFVLYLHFFVDARSHKIVGAEALSRWEHPEKGLLLPGRFIPLMEREKTVTELDYYVLERVCRFLESLYTRYAADFFISCNFSRNTFSSPDFAERFEKIIENYQFPRETLILELTESGIAHDAEIVYQNAVNMKKYGVSIALDDFGTGYSSFSDLQASRFDGLKLDKGLVENMCTEEGEIILQGIIDVGHRLGLTILAEGVETEVQVQKLVNMQCDVIQGFYFYKPLPLQEATKLYLEQNRNIQL